MSKYTCTILFAFIVLIGSFQQRIHGRSVYRKKSTNLPTIAAKWHNDNKVYRISDLHIEKYPTFCWRMKDFKSNVLPNTSIPYRNNPCVTVSGEVLNDLIEKTIQEIKDRKKNLTHVTILQSKNFNKRRGCGLIVLKFKQYPFVVKLFRENPRTFVNPYCKGIEPMCFFFMAGGANRHLAGLTRIKNRELVTKKIKSLPRWSSMVETPRKWFWLPKDPQWMDISGYNIEQVGQELHTQLPGTYAIVADAIETNNEINISRKEKKLLVMDLCNDLDAIIDPHFNNFIFSKNKTDNQYKIVIIDTEHFPTMVGLKEKVHFKSHSDYYFYLTRKCFQDTYLFSKKDQTEQQKQKNFFIESLLNS